MTPEAQRIAIAEACGWKPKPEAQDPKSLWPDVAIAKMMNDPAYLPDYLNDLNAMHEAEEVLTDFQLREYGNQLQEILRWYLVGYIEQDYKENLAKLAKIAHATATQRAEAFLRTLGLWT